MSRTPNHPPRAARFEATILGLAVVIDEPIRTEEARRFLENFDRQVAEIEQRHTPKIESNKGEAP